MLQVLPVKIDPGTWVLAFHRTSPYRLVRALAAGKYQHVTAFTYVAPLDLWLYYEVTIFRTNLLLLPNSPRADFWLSAQLNDADLWQISRRDRRFPVIGPFTCITALQHLIGLPGCALRPAGLLRLVRRHGGVQIDGRTGAATTQPRADQATAAS